MITSPAEDMRPTISRLLGADQNAFDRLVLDEPPGAHGVSLVHTRGTRASFTLSGLREDVTPSMLARAATEAGGVTGGLRPKWVGLRAIATEVGGLTFNPPSSVASEAANPMGSVALRGVRTPNSARNATELGDLTV